MQTIKEENESVDSFMYLRDENNTFQTPFETTQQDDDDFLNSFLVRDQMANSRPNDVHLVSLYALSHLKTQVRELCNELKNTKKESKSIFEYFTKVHSLADSVTSVGESFPDQYISRSYHLG